MSGRIGVASASIAEIKTNRPAVKAKVMPIRFSRPFPVTRAWMLLPVSRLSDDTSAEKNIDGAWRGSAGNQKEGFRLRASGTGLLEPRNTELGTRNSLRYDCLIVIEGASSITMRQSYRREFRVPSSVFRGSRSPVPEARRLKPSFWLPAEPRQAPSIFFSADVSSLNRLTGSSIQALVTGKGLLKRIGMTLALTAGLFVLISAIDADATPIRPDIRKLVTQNQSTQT